MSRVRDLTGVGALALGGGLVLLVVESPYHLSVGVFIGIHAIVTMGLCLLMGYAGQISLGQAAFYGLGAYVSGVLTVRLGVNPWLALVAAMALAGAVAWTVGRPILRLRGHYLALVTLAFGIIVYLAFVEFTTVTGGPSGLPGVPRLRIGGFVFDSDRKFFALTWAIAAAVLLLSLNIVKSRVGRALRALHASEVAAETLGVRTAEYKLKVFTLSAVYAGLAGWLYAHYMSFVSPAAFGFIASVEFVVMAAVGGLASVWGAPFGAAAVTLLAEAIRDVMPRVLAYASGEHEVIAYGLLLIVIMIFTPDGLTVGGLRALRHVTAGGSRKTPPMPDGGGKAAARSGPPDTWRLSAMALGEPCRDRDVPGSVLGEPPRAAASRASADSAGATPPGGGIGGGRRGPLPLSRAGSACALLGEASEGAVEAPSGELLSIREVRKAFGGVIAVNGVSFGVRPGEIRAVIGPNGAGKTTLFNLVSGLLPLDAGSVRFRGRALDVLPPPERAALGIGRTFQNLQLFAAMTALENVMVSRHRRSRSGFLGAALRTPRVQREERAIVEAARSALAFVGLDARRSAPAGSLAFGQQRLLEVARAVAMEPALLLLDEPAAGLNPAEVERLAGLIGALRARGLTILLVEHHMGLVMEVAEAIVVLDRGAVLAEGPPAAIRNDAAVVGAYLGTDDGDA